MISAITVLTSHQTPAPMPKLLAFGVVPVFGFTKPSPTPAPSTPSSTSMARTSTTPAKIADQETRRGTTTGLPVVSTVDAGGIPPYVADMSLLLVRRTSLAVENRTQ